MRNNILLSTAVGILLAGTAAAQDGTDTCTTPTPIGEGSFAFDTTSTPGQDDLPGCNSGLFAAGGLYMFNDMFWVYTATAAGDLTIDTIGSSFDTQLSVYSGIDCSAVCVDSDDDSAGSLRSLVTLTGVNIGDQFLVNVGGWNTNFGPGMLNVDVSTPPPAHPNNDCSIAAPITGTGSTAFDTTGATTTLFSGGGSCAFGASSVNQDIFFQWTAPATADYQIDTNTSAFDTKLSVHTGVACAATCTDYDDDGGAGTQSLISLTGVTMGDTFLIQVGGFSSNEGAGSLNITQAPDGSDCDLGLPISGSGAFAYDTTGMVSTGFTGAASGCGSVAQDFFYVWTADTSGDFQLDTELTGYDTKMSIYDGSDCSATCNSSDDDGGAGATSLITLLGVTAGDTFLVQVGGYGSNEGPGTLTITPTVDPCDAGLNEDAFEDNDTCLTAMAVPIGVTTGLWCSDSDSDFWSVSVPAGNILTVTLTQNGGDTDFDVLLADCVTSLGAPFGSWSVNNTGATSLDLVFEAFNYSGAGPCSSYELEVTIAPDPCGPSNDDALEDNDDCATALAMTDGTTTGLFASDTDNDFYAFCVANGDTVTVDILFDNSLGDMDLFLREPSSPGCGGEHGGVDLLAEGWSADDNENLVWTNTTGADIDVVLQVDIYNSGCNTYDMTIAGTGNCTVYLGAMYCTAEVNTTGVISSIFGTGDIVASNNAFGLLATGLPDGEFGYFIGSPGQAQVNNPGSSSGNLCVGGTQAIARFLPTLGAIAGGQIAGSVDLTNVPLPPTLAGMILAGDTFNFQLWHREGGPLSGMSNFSPGLEVTFQ